MERWAKYLTIAFVLGLSIAWLVWSFQGLSLSDADAYRSASARLLNGEELYERPITQDEAFRYAPWFAVAWIPLEVLPRSIGNSAWFLILLLASAGSVFPLLRSASIAGRLLAIVCGAMLLWTAARGNVHPLVILALVHGVSRRTGPLWIAMGASLKAVPILFVLAYVARREWPRAFASIAITVLLVAPMPLLGWRVQTTEPGVSLSLFFLVSPIVFVLVAGVTLAIAIGLSLRRSHWSALAAATASIALLPRLLLYDITYLLVGLEDVDARKDRGTVAFPPNDEPRWRKL